SCLSRLAALWDRTGRHLCGGEQKMLAIARALATDPSLLLLDEPSEGLSPLIVRILADALARIRSEGVTVLLADQNLMFARAVADRALVMERGRLVHVASRADLAGRDPALQRLLAACCQRGSAVVSTPAARRRPDGRRSAPSSYR